MGHYRLTARTDASVEEAFALWTNLERASEWIGGLTRVSDITGPIDVVGTRYTSWFGKMSSPTEVVAVERPRLFRTRFGNRMLRGESQAVFEPDGRGTRITQDFWTEGLIPGLMGRIFATGSYKGSFQGELNEFARLATAQARSAEGEQGVQG